MHELNVLCPFQEHVDLDEWLGASKTEPEGGLLSQKLLKKLGLEGAGSNGLNTRTSADDTADDDQTASDSGELLKSVIIYLQLARATGISGAVASGVPPPARCVQVYGIV